jgi:glycosyltransferase involved in cell wall biosynthesis
MKILMLLEEVFPPDVRVEKEARTLLKAGHELCLLSQGANDKPREEIIEGMKVIRTKLPPPRGFFSNGSQMILRRAWDEFRFVCNFIDPFWQKALAEAVEQEKPQALHIHDLTMIKTGLSVAQAFNIPLVADLHENFIEGLRAWRTGWKGKVANLISPLWRWKQMEKSCLSRVDKIITVVDEGKEHYMKDCNILPKRITVVMNVEDDYFYSVPIDEEIVKRYAFYFTILYVGGFGGHRGIHTAILAMPDILRKIPSARLLLVGSGSNEDRLKRLARDLGVAEEVEFCGWQPFALIRSYIAASHVCLVPHIASGHTNTTIPHKLFQYMVMAKPVIVSSAKPLTRIVKETGAGLIYPSGDAGALAETVIRVFRDKDLAARLGNAGRTAVEERYNWKIEEEKLIKLYQNLVGVK